MNQPRGRLAPLISAGLTCLLSMPAAAQYTMGSTVGGVDGELPWYVGAGQGFLYDTNVYNTTDGPSDTYSSTTLFGGFDQQISRQRFHGKASVAWNRYFDEKQRDNTSYDFALGLDWETVASLSGSLDGGVRQHLAYLSANSGVPTSDALTCGITVRSTAPCSRYASANVCSPSRSARSRNAGYSTCSSHFACGISFDSMSASSSARPFSARSVVPFSSSNSLRTSSCSFESVVRMSARAIGRSRCVGMAHTVPRGV